MYYKVLENNGCLLIIMEFLNGLDLEVVLEKMSPKPQLQEAKDYFV